MDILCKQEFMQNGVMMALRERSFERRFIWNINKRISSTASHRWRHGEFEKINEL